MKKFYDPPAFSWPPNSIENDSPLKNFGHCYFSQLEKVILPYQLNSVKIMMR